MLHHGPRVAGLLAIVAALLLAPGALAATPASGASAAAQARERAYGKHCGANRKAPARAAQRAKCLAAMAKLATGKSSSPSKACAGLRKKKAKGERKSAFARCVLEGAKLMKARRRAGEVAPVGAEDVPAPAGDEAGDPRDGEEAVDDVGSTPPDELVPEDFLSADELDPDF